MDNEEDKKIVAINNTIDNIDKMFTMNKPSLPLGGTRSTECISLGHWFFNFIGMSEVAVTAKGVLWYQASLCSGFNATGYRIAYSATKNFEELREIVKGEVVRFLKQRLDMLIGNHNNNNPERR